MGFFRWLVDALFGPPSPAPGPAPGPTPRQTEITAAWQAEHLAQQPAQQPVQPPQPGRRRSLTPGDLSAAKFAPIADDELRQGAAAIGRTWDVWQWRQDRVPPADDPRTKLIDRAMVTHGFLTPEELEAIHAVGAEWDEFRPDPRAVSDEANRIVARTNQERERRKEQKRAEAAERRRQRQEAIAHRKQTDIVFLGRGVSKGLADRRADVERLRSQNLPVLATPADIADALGIDIPRLRWLAFHNVAAERVHYVTFEVPKKSGGTRTLAAPHRDLARAQRWILQNILNAVPAHDAAHGFIRGRSTVTAAAPHVGAAAVVGCDIEDFFPSITVHRVLGVFRQLGYSPAAATVLALLCTECPRRTVEYDGQTYHVATGLRCLPQGACTSPALSNLVARRLDARLSGVARKLGCRYTRYADDMTISARGEAAEKVGWLLARVRHIVAAEGFRLNAAKTRVQRPNGRQTVTGVVVNERPGVPRQLARRLRAILHRARFEGLAAQNREDRPDFEAWLRGMVAYVSMVNPQQGQPLREALEQLSSRG
jgi:retron-type reverse transcriptase